MRIQFEEGMEEANNLFMKEHKAWEIAKRIQEQNEYETSALLSVTSRLTIATQPTT